MKIYTSNLISEGFRFIENLESLQVLDFEELILLSGCSNERNVL